MFSVLASCGADTAGKVSVSREYLQPEASKISINSENVVTFEEALSSCARGPKSSERVLPGLIANALAAQIIESVQKRLSKELKKYVSSTKLEQEYTFKGGIECIPVKRTSSKGGATRTENVLILQANLYTTPNGKTYGMKLRPIWFNPAPFKPEKPGTGENPELAIGMAVAPIYFVQHQRLTTTAQQVLLTKIPENTVNALAANEGMLIAPQKNWSDWPLLAGPPINQLSTLEIEIKTATKPPAFLTFFNKQLEENGDALQSQLADLLK